ncbi:MAG: hypothetical protein NTY75_01350 [Candidatus Shapirobacteria bacterium]|nr:hypothetical protein [Candidatus Shapirobacteria bacterium]MCX6789494.1 hypothetical protein [Candidatus Gribaldobacteria bacterium]
MFLLLFFTLFFTQPSIAQEPTTIDQFTQFKNNYTFQYNQYLTAYSKYLEKKDVNTKYGSVTTEADKLATAKDAINARNLALKTYLQALRVYLDKYKSADPATTDKFQTELQNWENWFNEQLLIVPNFNNANDLNNWVKDFIIKYIDIQQSIYSALVYNQINHQKYTLGLLNSLIDTAKADPNIKPENQLWLNNFTVRSDLVNTSLEETASLTIKKQYQTRFDNFYPDAKSGLNTANNYLRQIYDNLKIIIVKSTNPDGN